MFIKLNLRSNKWLLFDGYNNQKANISCFLKEIREKLNIYAVKYENILLLGDFNSEVGENEMSEFCQGYNLKNLIKEPTCFKNPENPSCIDLILTNKKGRFCDTKVIETGLSDYHKMTVTVLKRYFKKQSLTIITYRNYSKIDTSIFRENVKITLEDRTKGNGKMTYDEFKESFLAQVEKYSPLKRKTIRANNSPFMNKALSKS